LVIPSIVLGTDGPKLESIFLVSERLLVEVKNPTGPPCFDFVDRRRVLNYRISLGEHAVDRAEGQPITYQTASVDLVHFTMFRSTINYAGLDVRSWLETVIRAIPIVTLLDQQGPRES